MRILGHAGPLVTATAGIEIPLEPRALTSSEAEARARQQVAAIEAAESTPAPADAVRPSRRRPARTSPVPGTTTPPAPPAQAAQAALVVEDSAAAQVPAPAPAPVPDPVSDPDLDREVRQLRAELVLAGQRIQQLQDRVDEQAVCISAAAADVETSRQRADITAQLAAGRQQALTVRAEAAEAELAAVQDRIVALVAAFGPVPCTVCGIAVAPDYVARTGLPRHRCCTPEPRQSAGTAAELGRLEQGVAA